MTTFAASNETYQSKSSWQGSDSGTDNLKVLTQCKEPAKLLAGATRTHDWRLLMVAILFSSLMSLSAAAQGEWLQPRYHSRKLHATGCIPITPRGEVAYLLGSVTTNLNNDLYIVEYSQTSSDPVILHQLYADNYKCSKTTVTGIVGAFPKTHTFLMDKSTNDLYVVERGFLSSKITQWTSDDGWRLGVSYALSCPNSPDCSVDDYTFHLDADNNLYAFEYNTGSQYISVHVFNATSGYSASSTQSLLSLQPDYATDYKYLVSSVNSTVVAISTAYPITEIKEFNATGVRKNDTIYSSGVLGSVCHKYYKFLMGNNDDLYVVNTDTSANSGYTQLYVLSSSDAYSSTKLQTSIGLSPSSNSNTWVPMGKRRSNRGRIAAIAGGAAAGGVCLLIAVVAVVVCLRNKQRNGSKGNNEIEAAQPSSKDTKDTSSPPVLATVVVTTDNTTLESITKGAAKDSMSIAMPEESSLPGCQAIATHTDA